jgi:hypothetical protein
VLFSQHLKPVHYKDSIFVFVRFYEKQAPSLEDSNTAELSNWIQNQENGRALNDP